MQRIAVVDFGTGNLHSVSKAVEHVADDVEVVVTRDARLIDDSDRVILPGQGAMGSWLSAMRERGLGGSVRRALENVPVLGICLGMQALLDRSEEDGGTEGLGFISGDVRRFKRPESGQFKIPHMGWNRVRQCRVHPMWAGIEDQTRFYFVHSYYAVPSDQQDVAGSTDYILTFASAIARGNVFAVQFHPEKSHTQGLRILNNFVRWDGKQDR
jgi:glutamine amidotransferase